jgi:cytochrome c5
MKSLVIAAAAALTAASVVALGADESSIQLKEAPDAATVRAYCSMCHSADYIPMNSKFLKRAGWEAEVHKMIKVMGAPIPDEQAAKIIDYLSVNYGVE